jgi:hypothetical protein
MAGAVRGSTRATLSAAVFFCSWLGMAEHAQAGQYAFRGYYKSYSTAIAPASIQKLPGYESPTVIGAVNNRLRGHLLGSPTDWLSFEAAYDFSPRIQDKSLYAAPLLGIGLNTPSYRATDLRSLVYPSQQSDASSFAIYQNLDRLNATFSAKWFDVCIGRQAIAWGSARVINPTDILAPFAFNELDVEDRRGVDAVRLRIPLGVLSEIDAGYVAGEHLKYKRSALFLRGRSNLFRTDVSVTAIDFQDNLLLGLDLTRSLAGAGVWFEGAYVFADALAASSGPGSRNYFRSSIGCDYSLRDGTYLFIEYHFNQAGASHPADYFSSLNTTAYRNGSVYLLGRHYLAPGVKYQATPLITITSEALFNLGDPSVFLLPQVEYDVAENISVSAGAYAGLGRRAKNVSTEPLLPVIEAQSEFGAYPSYYFVFFRIYW